MGIAIDSGGDAYVTGETKGADFPVTGNAFQVAFGGMGCAHGDAFLTKFNPSGSALIYSSFLGGSLDEVAYGIAVDPAGDAYLTGFTRSLNFPTTSFAVQPVMNGIGNAFVTKFPLSSATGLSLLGITPAGGGNAGTVSPLIEGTGFHAGATASLACGGASNIQGSNVAVGTGGRTLTTTFNLVGASPGICDVVVTDPDGTNTKLAGAFTIEQGGAPNIRIELTGAARQKGEEIGSLGSAVLFVAVSNIGNVDSAGSFISLPIPSPFALASVSPPGITNLAGLMAGSEAQWGTVPLAAGSSQAFTATATSLSPIGPLTANACVMQDYQLQYYAGCLADHACSLCAPPPLGVGLCNDKSAEQEHKACLDCTYAISACSTDDTTCPTNVNTCLDDLSDFNQLLKIAIEKSCFNATCGASGCCTSSQLPVVTPSDPNALMGPPGVGGQHWITGAQPLTYVLSFGNESSANAPAQQVIVTQPLGSDLNLATLSLPGIILPNGSNTIEVPIPIGSFNAGAGQDEFTTNVDLRPTQNLFVNVDVKLNPSTQTLVWTLTSIDPTTGQPPLNLLVGFLPPGTGADVAFSVATLSGLPTETKVSEQGSVVFLNGGSPEPPVSTNIWFNSLDNTPPRSSVSPLPRDEATPTFTVQWSGTDVGSGIGTYSIYVSIDGGPFTIWQNNTAATSAAYTGEVGHSYGFYSIATDLVGNVEPAKRVADAIRPRIIKGT